MKRITQISIGALTLLTAALGGLAIAAPASATPTPAATKVVSWHYDNPTNRWEKPQTIATTTTDCGTGAYQIDTYKYDTPEHKATVDHLIATGVLHQGDDQTVWISNTDTLQKPCAPTKPAPTTTTSVQTGVNCTTNTLKFTTTTTTTDSVLNADRTAYIPGTPVVTSKTEETDAQATEGEAAYYGCTKPDTHVTTTQVIAPTCTTGGKTIEHTDTTSYPIIRETNDAYYGNTVTHTDVVTHTTAALNCATTTPTSTQKPPTTTPTPAPVVVAAAATPTDTSLAFTGTNTSPWTYLAASLAIAIGLALSILTPMFRRRRLNRR